MLLRRTAALGALGCLLAAPKLWVTSQRLFPATPAFGLGTLPYPWDYVLFGLTMAALAGMAVSRRPVFPAAFVALAAVLAALDQSRLQPWLIQFAVISGAAWCGAARPATRVFLVGLYAFAGLHKLHYGFAVMLAEMLRPLALPWGLEGWLTAQVLLPAGVAAALWEGGWGVGLAFQKTRRPAAACLAAMHAALLLVLGPAGLDLNRSVWAWNVANVVLLWALFWKDAQWSWADVWRSHWYPRATAAATALAGLLALPGWLDAYVGFGLYSGRTTTGALYVDPKRAPDLPEPVRKRVKADGVMDLNLWCSEEVGVPLYPETRVYRSAGRQVAIWLKHGDPVRVIEFSRPEVWTGRRTARSFNPLTE
jgi:hypothetical protein